MWHLILVVAVGHGNAGIDDPVAVGCRLSAVAVRRCRVVPVDFEFGDSRVRSLKLFKSTFKFE